MLVRQNEVKDARIGDTKLVTNRSFIVYKITDHSGCNSIIMSDF